MLQVDLLSFSNIPFFFLLGLMLRGEEIERVCVNRIGMMFVKE